MKKYILTLTLIAISFSAFCQNKITLEDLWIKYAYYPKSIYGLSSMNDGLHYTIQNEHTIEKYDYKTGKLQQSFSFKQGAGQIEFDGYSFSDDESKVLLATEQEAIYRHSTREKNIVYDLKKQTATPLSDKGKQMYATFSPAENKVAYIINNNLYYKDLDKNQEVQITTDGVATKIINGGSDWVYEEEFVLVRAFEWSPDGKKIAYLRFDETDVPLFEMPIYKGGLYPKNDEFKYPKVGEKNSNVTLYVYDLTTGKNDMINIPESYEYIPRIKWNTKGELVFFTMNRLQNDLKLWSVGSDHKAVVFFEEKAPSYLEIHDNLTFLNDGSFIWTSEADGYNHIYHYDAGGKLIRQLTRGNWEVTKFYGIDEEKKTLYYESAEVSPLERHTYSIQLDGKNKKQITTREGVNDVEFTSGFQYYICRHSGAGIAPSTTLYDKSGKEVRVLIDNNDLNKKLDDMQLKKPEFFSFQNSEGSSLNGYMIKPADFDAGKQYPVLMFVYGGPGSQQVMKQWGGFNYLWFQMLAQQGYIVACVDNRGTGARGRDFRTCTYQQLGKFETEDQIEAARYLGRQSYIDKDRIGIFGWSYGGYMSSLCITRGADVFKMAIAVAPVTNWKFYDSIYTERYMGTRESNPKGYDSNAPIAFADKLKGKYLLVHGTADDNVHWQNTAEMINALVKANKQFSQFSYPDRNHGIYGGTTRYHLYTMMTNFIQENL